MLGKKEHRGKDELTMLHKHFTFCASIPLARFIHMDPKRCTISSKFSLDVYLEMKLCLLMMSLFFFIGCRNEIHPLHYQFILHNTWEIFDDSLLYIIAF